ncbi:MAG: prephenate/arogenate dehydrogenase [Drouetiella hepatica Uher 2000/2452]|uniref:Prephenate/arogenate dehydrogenase n=1 Tax=Drouetiella hepatica Uher 2000/2452 TaxID=904376 RepID=A0A951QBQ4_9CYAN|nr:prephenate/arogenate dehydrogenase [Drouetiella hepatica Uher 2000/2452]
MKIGIVGLGLIGGSLAIDLRQLGHTLLGVSRKAETCEAAIAQNIVDDASLDLALMSDADVVFLCTPLGAIAATTEQLIPHLSPHTILTDVGSVKVSVVETIAPLWQNFVGGHPMAGTAESGLAAAFSGLFTDKAYVLTPIEATPPLALETVANLARSLQCQVYQCHPAAHDRAVAWISHLPVMVSASLIAACLTETDPTVLDLAQKFASSGFRDTSRVGGGNPELGIMMATYNREELLRSLHAYQQQIEQMIQRVEQQDWAALENCLTQTQQARPEFL